MIKREESSVNLIENIWSDHINRISMFVDLICFLFETEVIVAVTNGVANASAITPATLSKRSKVSYRETRL